MLPFTNTTDDEFRYLFSRPEDGDCVDGNVFYKGVWYMDYEEYPYEDYPFESEDESEIDTGQYLTVSV